MGGALRFRTQAELGYSVEIYSSLPPSQTTSSKAAASFKPHEVAYNDRTHTMVENSWLGYERFTREHPQGGVRLHTHWEASSIPKDPSTARYLGVVRDFQEQTFPNVPGGYNHAWRYTTYFIDTSVFMPYLTGLFKAQGGSLTIREPFVDLEQLTHFNTELVFNCTGLGARSLCNDDKMQALKGQIVTTDPQPDMSWSISADGFYVYPRKNDTVLGGTVEALTPDNEDENVDNGVIQLLIRGNKRILPYLTTDHVRNTYSGLRPYRNGDIRVEAEERGNVNTIHSYGHGGSGFTLSWGNAGLAIQQI